MTTKHETITVSGLVMYCDGCGKSGPEAAYDNHDDIIEQAEMMGWTQGDEKDFCDTCTAKQKKSRKKKP
jgi:hypothetical protein